MRYLILTFLLLGFSGCASKQQTLKSNFEQVKNQNMGVLLTLDLNTAGKIKRGQSCHLIITQTGHQFKLPLKEGPYNYALNLAPGRATLSELSCGMFYYYKIKEAGANFQVNPSKISYIGTLDFTLEDKGEMTWGPRTKSKRLLEARLSEMGLTSEDVEVVPLAL